MTAETITDEQIRELRRAIAGEMVELRDDEWRRGREIENDCLVALGLRRSPYKGGKQAARARCAEVLEARRKAGK